MKKGHDLDQPRSNQVNGPVERRREDRLPANSTVAVTVLDVEPHRTMSGMVRDISNHGLGLKVPSPIACGSPVKVEGDNILLLGEVRWCVQFESGFNLGLHVSECLGLQEIARFRYRMFG